MYMRYKVITSRVPVSKEKGSKMILEVDHLTFEPVDHWCSVGT